MVTTVTDFFVFCAKTAFFEKNTFKNEENAQKRTEKTAKMPCFYPKIGVSEQKCSRKTEKISKKQKKKKKMKPFTTVPQKHGERMR